MITLRKYKRYLLVIVMVPLNGTVVQWLLLLRGLGFSSRNENSLYVLSPCWCGLPPTVQKYAL